MAKVNSLHGLLHVAQVVDVNVKPTITKKQSKFHKPQKANVIQLTFVLYVAQVTSANVKQNSNRITHKAKQRNKPHIHFTSQKRLTYQNIRCSSKKCQCNVKVKTNTSFHSRSQKGQCKFPCLLCIAQVVNTNVKLTIVTKECTFHKPQRLMCKTVDIPAICCSSGKRQHKTK